MNKTIQFFALIDILISLVLLIPWLGGTLLPELQYWLTKELLVVDQYHQALMQILGAMVLLWATVRLKQTATWQVHYDCIARVGITVLLAYYAMQGLTVLYLFIIIELLGLCQWKIWKETA